MTFFKKAAKNTNFENLKNKNGKLKFMDFMKHRPHLTQIVFKNDGGKPNGKN